MFLAPCQFAGAVSSPDLAVSWGFSTPSSLSKLPVRSLRRAKSKSLLLRKDITWGFLFYLTAVIFFQQGFWIRLPAFPDLYPARVASILLYLVFLGQILMSIRIVPRLNRVEKTMIAFLVVMFISVVTSGQKPHWLTLLRAYIYPFLFFYFARSVINRETQVRIVLGYLSLVGIYFGVMGIKLLQGRTFTTAEQVTPNSNVIISRSTAAKLWPNQSPLGRTMRPRFGGQDTLVFTVVGVVEDVKQNDWRQAGDANVYFPLTGPAQDAWALTSPAYDLSSLTDPRIGYWRWFHSRAAGTHQPDEFDWLAVLISSDDGTTWTTVDTVRGLHNQWEQVTVRVRDFVTPTSTVRLRFVAND